MTNQQQQLSSKPLKVGLISCSNRQSYSQAKAKDYYSTSPLFTYSLKYCQKNCDQIYLITGNLQLISPEKLITPEDDHSPAGLIGKSFKTSLKELAMQIRLTIPSGSSIILLTDKRIARLTQLNPDIYFYDLPLKSLGIGQRLKWLKSQI